MRFLTDGSCDFAIVRVPAGRLPRGGGGLDWGRHHEPLDLAVATYDSAARHMDRLGDRYGLLVFDEAHHLPNERKISCYSIPSVKPISPRP
jgi:superfamily II DNA or RNA helicase